MKIIEPFELEQDEVTVVIDREARVLTCDLGARGKPVVWILHDTDAPKMPVAFQVVDSLVEVSINSDWLLVGKIHYLQSHRFVFINYQPKGSAVGGFLDSITNLLEGAVK